VQDIELLGLRNVHEKQEEVVLTGYRRQTEVLVYQWSFARSANVLDGSRDDGELMVRHINLLELSSLRHVQRLNARFGPGPLFRHLLLRRTIPLLLQVLKTWS